MKCIELTLSGLWIGWHVHEDLTCVVLYEVHDRPKVISVTECRGALSGKDYTNELQITSESLEQMEDLIWDRYEC